MQSVGVASVSEVIRFQDCGGRMSKSFSPFTMQPPSTDTLGNTSPWQHTTIVCCIYDLIPELRQLCEVCEFHGSLGVLHLNTNIFPLPLFTARPF